LHLHPESEIDLINALKNKVCVNGQLIIASHSVNILSHLTFEEVFLVKNNAIEVKNQNTINESITQLMGLDDKIIRLSSLHKFYS
jgi:predicted ATP-dependent endonuclease of OLD family